MSPLLLTQLLYPPLHFLVYVERGQERTPGAVTVRGADEKEVGSLIVINALQLPPTLPTFPTGSVG